MGWEAKLKTFEGQNFRDEKKGKSPAVSQKSQKAIPKKEAGLQSHSEICPQCLGDKLPPETGSQQEMLDEFSSQDICQILKLNEARG